MNSAEEKIIQKLLESDIQSYWEYAAMENTLIQLIQSSPFGTLSDVFINHEALKTFISRLNQRSRKFFMFWLCLEDYLHHKSNADLVQEKLTQVEDALKKVLEKITPQSKSQGTAMLPLEMANPKFMRHLFALEDKHLNELFLQYLPAPRANIFEGQVIPAFIRAQEENSTRIIKTVLEKNNNDLTAIEHKITKIQRRYRAKKRRQENLQRLPVRYASLWQDVNGRKPKAEGVQFARKLIADANTPYHPKCDPKLAERIMEAAKKVALFSTVSHLTSAGALTSIFNDGLYGRRSMLELYMPFQLASLKQNDIEEGDGNVVCMGANEIDPLAHHGIELQFDVNAIAQNNPCVFFKQKDLGFDPEKVRHVMIADLDLHCTHTGTYQGQPFQTSSFVLCEETNRCIQYACSSITKAIFIADNIKDMHQILTLNFFRFIDELKNAAYSEKKHHKEHIYAALDKLSDEELIATLLEIGKNMTDTMEFNFYGAYKIDFSALLSIKNEHLSYTLHLPRFIEKLKSGDLESLNEAMMKLPEIFNSYRFIDYLMSQTDNEAILTILQEQRENCRLPAWMERHNVDFKPK